MAGASRHYYVWVRSDRYRGHEPLTYSSTTRLPIGAIVRVMLRNTSVLGFISAEAPRPSFATKAIRSVDALPPLPKRTIQLAEWLRDFYASPIGSITSLFLPNLPEEAMPTPILPQEPVKTMSGINWTSEQQTALAYIKLPNTYVLHGRTGSGKTNIYIELAKRALLTGKSALILSPEIGLTSQLAQQFQAALGKSRIIILHSQLSPKQRTLAWLQILCTDEPLVVIGPRSALFSPLKRIGLIVIDEAHDTAYKQEQAPYYHTSRVAAALRKTENCILVLGSATPNIIDYYLAETTGKPIIRLKQLAKTVTTFERHTDIIDLKDRSLFSRSPHLSLPLIEAAGASLQRGEQVMLYLNRRGTARLTLCNNCGWQAHCPHCDLPLVYHGDGFQLRCHTCGYNQSPYLACPVCSNTAISLKSFGTKAIVDEAQRLFPQARIVRFDTDNKKAERLEERYAEIVAGDADILVGTQLIGKGLDLPKLTTLGIVLADSSLYLPDFTARERTYQLLSQVAGRVARGHGNGHIIVQTYYPDSTLIKAAIHDKWHEFYESELEERKAFGFPPFRHLLKLSVRRTSAKSAEQAAQKLKVSIETARLPIAVDGPAPAFHEKQGTLYQWQLVVKALNRASLLKVLQLLPSGWTYDIDPADLL